MVILVLLLPGLVTFLPRTNYDADLVKWKTRNLLGVTNASAFIDDNAKFLSGYILGWISAVIYFFSYPPQIIKNVS